MTVLENTELVSDETAQGHAKHFVRVALPEDVEYHTGDHLTVLADNPPNSSTPCWTNWISTGVAPLDQPAPDLAAAHRPRP